MGRRIDLLKSKLLPARAPTSSELTKVISDKAPSVARLLDSLGLNIENEIQKEARSIVPEAIVTIGQVIQPPYDPFILHDIANMHWVVRTCRDKLVREATRKGHSFEPNYEFRCIECETEYDYAPISEECPECQGELEQPDAEQLKRVKEFLINPNPQFTSQDILKRNASDLVTFDDFYVSSAKATSVSGFEVWPEDVRFMRLEVDQKGRLGGRTFCPIDEDTKTPGKETKLYPPTEYPPGSPCPKEDGGALKSMAYAQVYGSNVVAAFAKEEVLHDNLYAKGSRLYGTPKVWAVQTQILAMSMMDHYQADSFEKAKTPKNWVVYKGFRDEDIRRQMKQYEEAKKLNAMTDMHLVIPPDISSGQAQGNVGIDVIRGVDTPLIVGSIQFQEFYFKAICYTFGVDPASLGVETPGRLGGASENMANSGVSQEAIGEIQVQLAEAWDRFLKLKFPEIQDWHFILNSAYEEEESKVYETKKIELEGAKIAVDAGLDIVVDEDGHIKISGENTQEMRDEKQKEQAELQAERFGSAFGGPSRDGESAATAASKPFGKDIMKFTPPEGIGATGAKVYSECRSKWVAEHPDDKENQGNKTSCAKIAWTAQNRASKGLSPIDPETDIEKASRWQREIRSAALDYKEGLDKISAFVYGRLLEDFGEYLIPGPNETVNRDIADTIISRANKVLRLAEKDVAPMLEDAAASLYRSGLSLGLSDIQKQDVEVMFDEEDTAAIEAFYARTQDAMKNVLYFGDKQSYLSKIQDVTKECIEAGGCTTRILARRLQEALDPDREHFSDYMWERIAQTDSTAYITAGRLKAYERFDVPKVRRITASDVSDALCAPFTNAVYKLEDAYNVIPAHPNCLCAFAPYFGPEEPINP